MPLPQIEAVIGYPNSMKSSHGMKSSHATTPCPSPLTTWKALLRHTELYVAFNALTWVKMYTHAHPPAQLHMKSLLTHTHTRIHPPANLHLKSLLTHTLTHTHTHTHTRIHPPAHLHLKSLLTHTHTLSHTHTHTLTHTHTYTHTRTHTHSAMLCLHHTQIGIDTFSRKL